MPTTSARAGGPDGNITSEGWSISETDQHLVLALGTEVHVPFFTFSRFHPNRSKANRLEIKTQRNVTGNLLVEQVIKQIGVTSQKAVTCVLGWRVSP